MTRKHSDPVVSASHSLGGFRHLQPHMAFYMNARDLNTGPMIVQ